MFYFQTESPKKSMNVSFTLFRFAYNLDPDAANKIMPIPNIDSNCIFYL